MALVGIGALGAAGILGLLLSRAVEIRDHHPERYSGIWKHYGNRWTRENVNWAVGALVVLGLILIIVGLVTCSILDFT